MSDGSTIVAHASAPGPAPRGLLRLSGPETAAVLATCVSIDGAPIPADALPPRGIRAVRVDVDGLDLPALLLTCPAPRSYTGEDVAELLLPGHDALRTRVRSGLLAAAQRRGIDLRGAEPGEYTARAFAHGRMDLTRAEGVAATIAARSDAELRAAAVLRDGGLARLATTLAAEVGDALALLEAGIDFTDQEDVVPIAPAALADRLGAARATIAAQLERAVSLERLEAVPRVLLVGAPNAGKSTLFNALLGRTRAVTSAVAGPTRDVLEEPLVVPTAAGDAEVLLADGAGTAPVLGTLDAQMAAAREATAARAELRLHCVPADVRCDEAADAGAILVRTKSDVVDEAIAPGLAVCAPTGAGLDALRREIGRRLGDRAVSLAADALVVGERHAAALSAAAGHLEEALAVLAPQRDARDVDDPAIVAALVRAALDEIGAIAGDVAPDDILGRIFSRFCVGK